MAEVDAMFIEDMADFVESLEQRADMAAHMKWALIHKPRPKPPGASR